MIKLTRYHSPTCLKCEKSFSKLIKIGAYFMCDGCYFSEFGFKEPFIDPNSDKGKIYYKWLKKYNQE